MGCYRLSREPISCGLPQVAIIFLLLLSSLNITFCSADWNVSIEPTAFLQTYVAPYLPYVSINTRSLKSVKQTANGSESNYLTTMADYMVIVFLSAALISSLIKHRYRTDDVNFNNINEENLKLMLASISRMIRSNNVVVVIVTDLDDTLFQDSDILFSYYKE